MASVADAARALAFMAALVFGVFLGRPLYWGLQVQRHLKETGLMSIIIFHRAERCIRGFEA